MLVIPWRRSSIAAAIPPKPAPTISTSSARLVGCCGPTAAAAMRLLLLVAVLEPYASGCNAYAGCWRRCRAQPRGGVWDLPGVDVVPGLGLVVVDRQARLAQALAAARANSTGITWSLRAVRDEHAHARCAARGPAASPPPCGMKPEKARIPRGAGRSASKPSRSSSPRPSRSRQARSAEVSAPSAATARRAARRAARLAASKSPGRGSRRAAPDTSGSPGEPASSAARAA